MDVFHPQFSCMLLSTPQGIEMGTEPEMQNREWRMEGGGSWMKGRGGNHTGIMQRKAGCSKCSGEYSSLTVDDTDWRPFFTSNRDSPRPEWMKAARTPGTTSQIHPDSHLWRKIFVFCHDFDLWWRQIATPSCIFEILLQNAKLAK